MEDIEKLREQVKHKPDSILLVMKLAEALRASGRHREAASALAAGLKLKPKFIKARKLLGEVCFDAGKFDLAEREFRRILSVMPEDIDSLLMLGDSFRKQGKKKEALTAYKKVLKIDPYEKRAKRNVELMTGGEGADTAGPVETEPPPVQEEAAEEMEEDSTMVMEAPVFEEAPPEAPEVPEVPETVTLEPEKPGPPPLESPFDAEEPGAEASEMPEDATMVMEAPEFGRPPQMPETEGAEPAEDPLAETVRELPLGEGDEGAEGDEPASEMPEDATMVMSAPVFDMDGGPAMDEPSEFEADAGAPVEHFDADAIPEVPETVTLEPDAGEAIEHFEADTSEVEEDESGDMDATMVMAAPMFDMDEGPAMDEPSEFEADAGAEVEHLEAEPGMDETSAYDSVAGAEVEHAEAGTSPAQDMEPDIETGPAKDEAPEVIEEAVPEDASVEGYEEEEPGDEDSTMVMEAPVFDMEPAIETGPAMEEAAEVIEEVQPEVIEEVQETGALDESLQDDVFAGYDENPDGDMIVGEIDMDMETDVGEEEDAGFGRDEFLSADVAEGAEGLEPGAMDFAEEAPADDFEVGEIEIGGLEEEYESASDLEHAAERMAEEVFVEDMDDEPGDEDATMVMEAPSFEEPAAYEEPAMEVEEEDEGMTMEVAPPVFDETATFEEDVVEEEAAVAEEAEVEVEAEIEPEPEEAVPATAFEAPEPGAISEADGLIEAARYVEAMEVYNKILEQAPDHGPVLQRVQELRLLMKVQGKEGELVEHQLDKFLSAIQRRRDEFHANP